MGSIRDDVDGCRRLNTRLANGIRSSDFRGAVVRRSILSPDDKSHERDPFVTTSSRMGSIREDVDEPANQTSSEH